MEQQKKKKEIQSWRGAVLIKLGGKTIHSFQVSAGRGTAEQVQRDAERLRKWLGGDEVAFEREGDSEIAGG